VADVATNKPRIKIIGIPNDVGSTQPTEDGSYTGTCFGHQVIARALGGECAPNSNWEFAITEVVLTDLGQRIFGVPSFVSSTFWFSSCCIPNAMAERPTDPPRPCTQFATIMSPAWVDDQD